MQRSSEKDGIKIRGVYERSDAKVRELEGLERTKGFIGAEFDTNVEIVENDIKYIVDVKDGQKTGFFLDQKLNRMSIRPLCKNARVLDCFTHTGSFGLNAMAGGAKSILSVDASDLAIDQAMENARLNGFDARKYEGDSVPLKDESGVAGYKCADIFDLLPSLERSGELYDVVILDPPAFTKSRASIKKAVTRIQRDQYKRYAPCKKWWISCNMFPVLTSWTKTCSLRLSRGSS